MPFPELKERVIYKKSTLVEVLCQLRFPPILLIEKEIPATFQERIRSDYPYVEEKVISPMPEIQRILSGGVLLDKKAYDFKSVDGNWTAALTKDFIALTTKTYTRWEIFKNHLNSPLKALEDVYKPNFYTRIGLRYQNVIQRSRLGLGHVEWKDLLNPQIVGELASPPIAAETVGLGRDVLINLADVAGQARIRHGFATLPDDDEICYFIDTDIFTEQQTEIEHAIDVLTQFNGYGSRIFQWYISERLHEAMEPELVR